MKTSNCETATPYTAVTNFNYRTRAELFGAPGRQRHATTYWRFASGADAVFLAFDANRDRIFKAAGKAYSPRGSGFHALSALDF